MESLMIYSVVSEPEEVPARSQDHDEEHNLSNIHHNEEDYLPEITKRKRWISIYLLCFVAFIFCSTFSIIMSSIWPYLLEVDYKNASARTLGWIVAAYSFGQLIASPFFGFWGDKRPTREPLIVALLIMVLFNILYSYCGAFKSGLAGWIMLISRAMVGFGAGVGAVVRSYVSEATTEKERTGALAGVSSAQGLGFILGPALGLVFVPLGSEGLNIDAIKFKLNMYTGPGYLNGLLGIIAIILLAFVFQESKLVKSSRRKNPTKLQLLAAMKRTKQLFAGCLYCCPSVSKSVTSTSTTLSSPSKKPFDKMAALLLIFLFFGTYIVFSAFESLGSALTMDEFAWTKKQAVLYNNVLCLGLSIISILTYIVVKFIAKKADERMILMIASFISAFAFFGMIPMTDDPPNVSDKTRNGLESWIPEQATQNLTVEVVGCRDPPQTWCTKVGRIFLPQYIIAQILFAIGFSAANLTALTIFSKILGPFPQGTMMGFLTSAMSLARGLGPLVITLLYQHKGPVITFATLDAVVGVSIVVLLVFYRRLVPYKCGP